MLILEKYKSMIIEVSNIIYIDYCVLLVILNILILSLIVKPPFCFVINNAKNTQGCSMKTDNGH